MNQPRVLLMQLSERTSGKGNRYLSGWLGKASVVAFAGEPDKHGNPTWDLFVSEPQPRAEAGAKSPNVGDLERDPARRPQARDAGGPAKPSASPVARGDGWRGPQYRRPANGAARAPAGEHEPFYDDDLADIGR